MVKRVYGVDLSKTVTPVMVRNAIFVCFKRAHKEVLDLMDEYAEWKSNNEREEFRNLEIELIIHKAFKESDVEYDNPTKDGLSKVTSRLAELAREFRKKEVVEKHYFEIRKLIDSIE